MKLIFGSSGFAREVEWLISEINDTECLPIDYFIGKDIKEAHINGISVIEEDDLWKYHKLEGIIKIFIAIGSPHIKEKIFTKLVQQNIEFIYPVLIHPSCVFDKRKNYVSFDEGTIICAGNLITSNIKIGKFVHLNLGCTLGHDSLIGNFSTISPGTHISGNVSIGKCVFIGTGAVILENITICDNAVIGAGAVVTKSIEEPGIYVGIPAKKIDKK